MSESPGDVTVLLARVRDGNREAANLLIPVIYSELRRIATGYLRRERPDHTLQATALVHEAYLRIIGNQPTNWQNRAHFFAIAAHTMRQVLLDYARRRYAEKRGGSEAHKVDIDVDLLIDEDKLEDILALDEALNRLEVLDPRQSRLVELRFFAGLSVEEAAEVMRVSPVTIKREWRLAKAWLRRELTTANSE